MKAKTRSLRPGITVVDGEHLVVAVRESPTNNRANFAILEAVAKYFSVSLGQVRLVSGRSATQKVIEIER